MYSKSCRRGDGFNQISLKAGENNVDIETILAGNVIIIMPEEELDYNTVYTLTIPRGAVIDEFDNCMEEDYLFAFTTQIRARWN